MDHHAVEKMEDAVEDAIADVIVRLGLRKLPVLPSRRTIHLMAKAAVAVYEAAVEKNQKG